MSRLHNPEATLWGWHKKNKKDIFHVVYGMAEEPMEVQEETVRGTSGVNEETHQFFKI